MCKPMTASERFENFLAGKPVDRAPIIEWAPWWHLTVARWIDEGVPAEKAGYEALQEYFGLDKCIQSAVAAYPHDILDTVEYGGSIIENEDDYHNKLKPLLFTPPEKLFSEEFFANLRANRERGDTLQFFSVEGFFWYPRMMLGIENHLYSFYDYPDLYKLMCEDYANWLIEVFEYLFSRFRFDFMTFAEDMSYNNGPMVSKDIFDEFLAPYYNKVIPVIHKYKVPVIIDSDGDITLAVDWYAGVGADGMLPLERQAGTDVSVYINKQPQMAFIGHFDKMCLKYGEEAIRAEFERVLPSMQNGKLISSVDHQTPPDVSVENYRTYIRLFKEYAAKVTHTNKDIKPCKVFEE
ncbi:MAG: hypothetical protein IJN65_04450 [Clostridia bacterium]|nr:hypothetical protein [Clostridia bacterium]